MCEKKVRSNLKSAFTPLLTQKDREREKKEREMKEEKGEGREGELAAAGRVRRRTF